MRIVVLGGAGFVGSSLARTLVAQQGAGVLVIDKLTATASMVSLAPVASSPRFKFRHVDVADRARLEALLHTFGPDAVIDATPGAAASDTAAESLIGAVAAYVATLPEAKAAAFRLVAVANGPALTPSASALLAAHAASGLPVAIVRSAPAFGPYQFPDRSVAAMVVAALGGRKVELSCAAEPWIFIDDLVSAILATVSRGEPGKIYDVAGRGTARAVDLAAKVSTLIERHAPGRLAAGIRPITRPALLEAATSAGEMRAGGAEVLPGWRPAEALDSALSTTVRWYLANEAWWRPLDAARDVTGTYGLLRTA